MLPLPAAVGALKVSQSWATLAPVIALSNMTDGSFALMLYQQQHDAVVPTPHARAHREGARPQGLPRVRPGRCVSPYHYYTMHIWCVHTMLNCVRGDADCDTLPWVRGYGAEPSFITIVLSMPHVFRFPAYVCMPFCCTTAWCSSVWPSPSRPASPVSVATMAYTARVSLDGLRPGRSEPPVFMHPCGSA